LPEWGFDHQTVYHKIGEYTCDEDVMKTGWLP
jgi:hypothetical protein